jgi:hypothetical protein
MALAKCGHVYPATRNPEEKGLLENLREAGLAVIRDAAADALNLTEGGRGMNSPGIDREEESGLRIKSAKGDRDRFVERF